ncbi:hypothetical protein N7474_001131 [Penicillium riverlandense]|uniref:uncharacterized protein n=1 Tax=Penicillium riverlandense TaxID=1903569 RepID=UPI002549758B|nr:uncharacterized protein N7474_001131 [Penicillium riverlandense]KAJ5832820.1 hypothetical protein N7474_001131 [Penicillium riverlandense]
MGHRVISRDFIDHDTRVNFDARASVHSVEDEETKVHPAIGSTIQLFESEQGPDDRRWQPGIRDRLVFICIIILAMMDAFDATVMIPVLPHLANAFQVPLVTTLWVNTAYLALNAASQLFFPMLCEVFSHGPLWIIAVVFATIGTGICSGSMTLPELIVGRLVQGFGAGGSTSLCFVVMAESSPEPIQARYSSYILLTRMLGAILGPIVGGLFVDNAHWTWAFYFNFIFCALGMLAIPFAVDLRFSKNIPLRKLRILDWSGATMVLMGAGGIILGLSWGGVYFRWVQWETLAPIAVGFAGFVALAFYETFWALHPLFCRRVFRSCAVVMTYVGCFLHGFLVFCQLQYFALYFMSTKYLTPTVSGITLLAITGLAMAPAAVVGIILAHEMRFLHWIISSGWMLTLLAAGCAILLNSTTPTVGWVFLFFSAGLGHGLLLASYNIRIWNAPKDEAASWPTKPTTMALLIRGWGMATAVPVGGVVFLTFLATELDNIGLQRDLINTAHGYLILMNDVQMDPGQRETIKAATAVAFRVVWELLAGVAALGGISSVFLWKKGR